MKSSRNPLGSGRKTNESKGLPLKRGFNTKISAVVLDIIRAQPNQAAFIERLVLGWAKRNKFTPPEGTPGE